VFVILGLKKFGTDKHSSLLQTFINYDQKSFINLDQIVPDEELRTRQRLDPLLNGDRGSPTLSDVERRRFDAQKRRQRRFVVLSGDV
jgi:hypothetical protein